jgi:hypothetical protein
MRLSERTHIARKQHQCVSCCCVPIEPGETYIRWAGLTDGDFCSLAMHIECREWEEFLNQEAGYRDDEWTPLYQFIESEGDCALDGAPYIVRERFRIAGQRAIA